MRITCPRKSGKRMLWTRTCTELTIGETGWCTSFGVKLGSVGLGGDKHLGTRRRLVGGQVSRQAGGRGGRTAPRSGPRQWWCGASVK